MKKLEITGDNVVRENRKSLEQIQLFEKKLNNMYCTADCLKETRNKVEKQKCNTYIVETFAYIESMLEILALELQRIESVSYEHEEVVVVEDKNGSFLVNFSTGVKKEIRVMQKSEFEEYVNRRAGTKIY